jgi:hypothetical protein
LPTWVIVPLAVLAVPETVDPTAFPVLCRALAPCGLTLLTVPAAPFDVEPTCEPTLAPIVDTS